LQHRVVNRSAELGQLKQYSETANYQTTPTTNRESMKTRLLMLGSALAIANGAIAGFTPIPLAPSSFNHDVVIEATAPQPLNSVINVTMDGGTNRNGNTWYEQGYNPAAPTTGLPVAGSLVTGFTNAALNHTYRMAPDYHVNNVIMVGHNNGGQTPLLAPGTFTLTTPAKFGALSFLSCSANGPVLVGYRVHYADGSEEEGQFSSLDWFNQGTGLANVFNTAGLVGTGGGVNNINGVARGAGYAADVFLGNSTVNVTSVDLWYVGSGANNNPNNNGRAAIFALAGSPDGATYSPIAVTGYTYDAVVEADGPQTTGTGVATAGALTNFVTATMDGGLSKVNNCWYEKGYFAAYPETGLPTAGSSVTSIWYSAYYTMPPSYIGNCAALLATNVASANITLATPAAFGALSFLCATANGDTFIPCVVKFQDGTAEDNTIFIPDWFNRVLPWSYLSFGRVNPSNGSVNNTPEQFVDPFLTPYPYSFDFRGLALPAVRLFDAVINITNTASAITNISLTMTNTGTRVAAIFAVSGAAPGNVPPIFGAAGTPTPGQPNNAPMNNISLIKRWEGTNTIVLSVTNIAGTSISYQWKKAPRGGGLRDKLYSFDYSTFANVVDGGRISGANTRVLTINNALTADSADYLLIASNPYGSATSAVATVMLLTTNQSVLVGKPLGDVITPIAADATPVAESIDHVIDRVAQKWLSDGLQWSGACCGGPLPFTGPVGFEVTPVSGGSIVSAMRFYPANDSQGRDPMDYGLEGSNDGTTWTPITGGRLIGTLSLPTVRNTTGAAVLTPIAEVAGASVTNMVEVNFPNTIGYKAYRVSITNTIDRLRQALMQVAEIELLGTLVANPPVWVRQPEPATVFAGGSPTFYAVASGYPLPKYQWFKNGTLVAGATSSAYTFPNAQLTDSGATFRCVASNSFAQITSSSAALTVIASPAQPYLVAAMADAPIGFWRLHEGPNDGAGNNGVLAYDSRGGNNGYYSNTVLQATGYNPLTDPDKAADFGTFQALNSYVANIRDVGFARAPGSGSGGTFSVEAWVNGPNQTVNAAIVTKGYNGILTAGTGTGTEQFTLDVLGTPRAFRFLVRDAAGNGSVAQSTVLPYDPITLLPVWHHLVGVCDQPNGKIYLYVDGLLAGTGNIGVNAGILAQPLPMTIGARQSGGAAEYDNQWTGVIDEVALYNTALSPSQVLGHYYGAQLPPLFITQPTPTNATMAENVSVTFESLAYGAGTINYQWYLSDSLNPTTRLAGQTSPNLTFTTAAAQNGNYYQVVVTNLYGSITSAPVQLNVVSGPPSFLVDLPTSSEYLLGHVIQLQVNPGGTAPFTYQWQKNGVNLTDDYRISGSQTNVLTIGYGTNSDSGSYRVLVSNGTTTPSTVDVVTVTNGLPSGFANPASWTLQGTPSAPTLAGNRLEISSGLGNTARSAFLTEKLGIASFTMAFIYQTASGAGGADGATFCIQNDTRGAAAVGTGGGGLGYGAITPSVALGLNIYASNTRGIRLLQNGTMPTAGAGAYTAIDPVLLGGNTNPVQVNLTYSLGVLTASFKDTVTSDTYTTNFTVDIPGIVGGTTAFVGFTGADGGTVSTQVISNFTTLLPAVSIPIKSQKVGGNLVLSWPASTGAFLKATPSLTSPVWTDATDTFRVVGDQAQVTVTPSADVKFYRLMIMP
jgi:hypothetical protein